jgi:peptidoglycan/LPS O-acetylase OafA/YrhL
MMNIQEKYDNLLVLRGIACFVVVLDHLLGFANRDYYVPFGFHMVWLFFFLSSYLLTKGFITGRFHTTSAYYKSRAARLLPAFYYIQFLAIALVICSIAPSEYFPVGDIYKRLLRECSILIYAPWTPYILASNSWNSVIWSTVVEMHFIILLPFIVHTKLIKLIFSITAWMGMLLLFEYKNIDVWQRHYETHYYNLGFFAAGMMAARMEENRIKILFNKWYATLILGISVLIIDLIAHNNLQQTLRLAPIFFVPMLLIVFPAFDTNFQKPLPNKYIQLLPRFNFVSIFEKLGAISYSLYLTHKFIGITLINYFGFFIGFLGVFIFSSIVYIEVETRFRHTRFGANPLN